MILRAILSFLCLGIAINSYALSIKCKTTYSLASVKEVVVQNVKSNYGQMVDNKNGFILLDGKRKLVGVKSFSHGDGFLKYAAKEGQYAVEVYYTNSNDREKFSEIKIREGRKSDVESSPLECQEIKDTQAEVKADSQPHKTVPQAKAEPKSPFCKLGDLTDVAQIKNWIKEEPTITKEGDFNILKFPSGAVVKSRAAFGNIDSYTLPPNVKCK